jgi:protein-S-isoprenylcysteine O-methyltransferase Ste14
VPVAGLGVVVAAWALVLAHNATTALREGTVSASRVAVGAAYVALLAAAVVMLERSAGAGVPPALVEIGGGALVVGGAVLHVRTRAFLGARWATATMPPRGATLVTDGPYRTVRHPLYLALLLMAAGSVAAHPSIATACAAVGLAAGLVLKIRREERALAAAFGPRWDDYRARVPALVPRLTRGTPR